MMVSDAGYSRIENEKKTGWKDPGKTGNGTDGKPIGKTVEERGRKTGGIEKTKNRKEREHTEMAAISGEWLEALRPEFSKPYYRDLFAFVQEEYRTKTIYPPAQDLFNALHETPLGSVRAVILGQDPYHGEGQAHGMCFSVRPGCPAPPSLVNIYRELHDDLGCYEPNNGYLLKWARQGVLLLNTVLTVRAHQAGSHRGRGWEQFTDAVLRTVSEQDRPIVYMLWGSPAQAKAPMLTNPRHLILRAPHPSPLSAFRGFFGCRHFSKCNAFLEKNGVEPIDWQVENL